MARIDSFLRLVVEQRASDLHFHAGNPPIIRHDGELVKLPFRMLSEYETSRFLLEMLSDEQKAVLAKQRQVDLAYVLEGVARFRVSVFAQSRGLSAVFRVVSERIPTLDELRLPPAIKRLTMQANGLVLITGPTGSGKSTTLAALVHEINATSKRHVITIEDPIEFVHTSLQGLVTQRQVGRNIDSFAAALRSALRESPDVLVIGEMRDFETVSLAVSAAETGVLVIGTLHTNSAAKAIDRIIDVCPEEIQDQTRGVVSVLLKGVVAQQLCRRATGEGRIAVTEVLLHSYAMANMIRENKVFQLDALLQSDELAGTGNQSLDRCILQYVREGAITTADGLHLAAYPDTLAPLLAALPDVA
jgi:twitching motility protein PilT